jgi:hypothetical protein
MFGEISLTGNDQSDAIIWETGMPTGLTVPDSIQLTVVSTDAGDTQDIHIVYLDGNLNEQVETVTLTGTTPVLTAATDIRAINKAYSIGGPVSGLVTMTNGGVTYALIPAGSIQFDAALYRVPAGKRVMINAIYGSAVSGSNNSQVTIKIQTTQSNGYSFANQGYFFPLSAIVLQDGSGQLSDIGPFPVNEGEWVAFTVNHDKTSRAAAGALGWIEDLIQPS